MHNNKYEEINEEIKQTANLSVWSPACSSFWGKKVLINVWLLRQAAIAKIIIILGDEKEE